MENPSISHDCRQVYQFSRTSALYSTGKTWQDLHQWRSNKSLVPFEIMEISPYFSTGRLPIAQALRGRDLTAARGLNNFMSSHLCLNCNLYSSIMIKFLKICHLTLPVLISLSPLSSCFLLDYFFHPS